MTEYEKAPKVTRERMYLEAMQTVYTNTTKVLVDQKSNSNLLFLPLDRLISGSNSTAGNRTFEMMTENFSDSSAGGDAATAVDRTRDAFRVRDREGR